MTDETKEQIEADLADLDRCEELHALARTELELSKVAEAHCNNVLAEMHRLTNEVKALAAENDAWAERMKAHTDRAAEHIAEAQRVRQAVQGRIAVRKAGADPRKLEA